LISIGLEGLDEDLNVVQQIIIGKLVLWLESFGCPDSFKHGTAYGMMNDIWETFEEYLL